MRWNRSFDCMERNMKHIEGLWPQSKCACFQGEQVLWDIRTLVILQMQQQSRCSFCVLVSLFHILLHSDVSQGLNSSNYLLITILQRREEYWQWWGRIKQHDDVHEKEKIFLHDFTVFVFWVCQETASISSSNCSCLYTGFERSSILLTWN